MKSATSLACYLIGQGPLLIQFAKILQTHRLTLNGVISNSTEIRVWACAHNIRCLSSLSEIDWDAGIVDYLFCIMHNELIAPSILAKLFYGTIVLHDSLLPRYAGQHACAWALINRESLHGISWHLANETENAGALLHCAAFRIDATQTTQQLRSRCQELAVSTFPTLINQLVEQSSEARPQDLSQRSWFGPFQKPYGNGWIDWHADAEQLACLWRASQFGQEPNTFTTLKLLCADEVLVVRSFSVLPQCSDGKPGQVVALLRDQWQVKTGSSDVLIDLDYRKHGVPLRADAVAKNCGLKVNDILPSPEPEMARQFQLICERAAEQEAGWVQTLKQFRATPVSAQVSVIGRHTLPRSLYYRLVDFFSDPADLPLALLTAWLIYLYRFGGQSRIGICVLNHARLLDSAYQPFFASALPCEFEISGNDSFRKLLDQVRTYMTGELQRQPYLVDLWHRYPELAETVMPQLQSVPLDLNFNCDKPCLMVEQLPDAFLSLCNELLQQVNTPVDEIDWLTDSERQKMLAEWNIADIAFPDHKTIHRLFEEQVYKTPHQPALLSEEGMWSYHELNGKINQLAHYLITFHLLRPNEPVAILLERDISMLVTELGVLKAGGTCLPLDPDWPTAHIASILHDAKMPLMITTEKLAHRLRSDHRLSIKPGQLLILDAALTTLLLSQQSCFNTRVSVQSEQTAFLFYGGPPQTAISGVALDHQGVINQLMWLDKVAPITCTDRILQCSSGVQHYSLLELFWANWFGAAIVLSQHHDREDHMMHNIQNTQNIHDVQCDPHYLCGLIAHHQITVLALAQTNFDALVRYLTSQPVDLPSLRHIICHGSPAHSPRHSPTHSPTNDDSHLLALLPGVRCHFLYGCVETSLHVLHAELPGGGPTGASQPVSNTRSYILDKKLRPLPFGVRGELYISGMGVVQGYWNQPELTAARFVANPFQTELDRQYGRHARLYRTGDFGYALPGGQFVVLDVDKRET